MFTLLRADETVLDAMLDGWRAQKFARGLEIDTIKARCRVIARFVEFTIIACPDYDERLWDMLELLQPPSVESLVETTPQLERAISRLTTFIGAVQRLLATDEANLADFY